MNHTGTFPLHYYMHIFFFKHNKKRVDICNFYRIQTSTVILRFLYKCFHNDILVYIIFKFLVVKYIAYMSIVKGFKCYSSNKWYTHPLKNSSIECNVHYLLDYIVCFIADVVDYVLRKGHLQYLYT